MLGNVIDAVVTNQNCFRHNSLFRSHFFVSLRKQIQAAHWLPNAPFLAPRRSGMQELSSEMFFFLMNFLKRMQYAIYMLRFSVVFSMLSHN